MEINWSFPAGLIGNTYENLLAAAAGKRYEHTEMYPGFAKVAREEGFIRVADVLEAVCVAERQHEKNYLELAANVKDGLVFKRHQEMVWRCLNCGYLHVYKEAPEVCPACISPQGHFEILGGNW